LEHVRNRLHGDFDRGFFSAWADCMRVLSKMDVSKIPNANNAVSEKAKLETLQSDKSQVSMEDFLKEQEP
jgi:hypothetical protein